MQLLLHTLQTRAVYGICKRDCSQETRNLAASLAAHLVKFIHIEQYRGPNPSSSFACQVVPFVKLQSCPGQLAMSSLTSASMPCSQPASSCIPGYLQTRSLITATRLSPFPYHHSSPFQSTWSSSSALQSPDWCLPQNLSASHFQSHKSCKPHPVCITWHRHCKVIHVSIRPYTLRGIVVLPNRTQICLD